MQQLQHRLGCLDLVSNISSELCMLSLIHLWVHTLQETKTTTYLASQVSFFKKVSKINFKLVLYVTESANNF